MRTYVFCLEVGSDKRNCIEVIDADDVATAVTYILDKYNGSEEYRITQPIYCEEKVQKNTDVKDGTYREDRDAKDEEQRKSQYRPQSDAYRTEGWAIRKDLDEEDKSPNVGEGIAEYDKNVLERIRSVILGRDIHMDPDSLKTTSRFVDDLGYDSLDRVETIMAVEDEFNIELLDSEIEGVNTVGDAVMLVQRKVGEKW